MLWQRYKKKNIVPFTLMHPNTQHSLFANFFLLPVSLSLPQSYVDFAGRNSVSCAWLKTDKGTKCFSARNSSRRTAGKSARQPRMKSWSWNCTQAVGGQMDEWLTGSERQRAKGETDLIFFCFHLNKTCNHEVINVRYCSCISVFKWKFKLIEKWWRTLLASTFFFKVTFCEYFSD